MLPEWIRTACTLLLPTGELSGAYFSMWLAFHIGSYLASFLLIGTQHTLGSLRARSLVTPRS